MNGSMGLERQENGKESGMISSVVVVGVAQRPNGLYGNAVILECRPGIVRGGSCRTGNGTLVVGSGCTRFDKKVFRAAASKDVEGSEVASSLGLNLWTCFENGVVKCFLAVLVWEHPAMELDYQIRWS